MTSALTLPYPPSLNRYWRSVPGMSPKISAEGRAYRRDVIEILSKGPGVRFGSDRLAVAILTHAPDRRRRDLDNIPKALLDALEHAGIYEDDGQIDDLRITRGEVDKQWPRVVVCIGTADI